MKGNDIRQAYLSFFESKGHLKLDSFPLIPKDDPSLLLIGSGDGSVKTVFYGKGRTAEAPCNHMPEMYPYR